LFRHHEKKFFSSVSVNLVVWTAALDQCPRNSLEHFITLQMAILIIIKFKMVDIAHNRAKAFALLCDARQNDVEILPHFQAIPHLRKSVYPGLSEELAIEPLELDWAVEIVDHICKPIVCCLTRYQSVTKGMQTGTDTFQSAPMTREHNRSNVTPRFFGQLTGGLSAYFPPPS
jgi:hypothetical protein